MKKPTRLLATLTAGALGGTTLLVASTGLAAADDNRYSLFAQGDSQYYQLDGQDIPASPKNAAGSLTAQAQTDSTGQTTSFAGAPYYGKTAQTLPGTVNGVPNQFGYGQLQLPFSQFPGYVTASHPSQPKAEESEFYYKVHAEADENGAKAAGSNGAPDAIPAPNQQQVATAEVKKLANNSTLTTAEGSAAGFLEGPLEVGYSDARARISDLGDAPEIDGAVFGRFSVSGQNFGYNKSGFTYLGQSQDKKAALDAANAALKAAGIELDIAPETTRADPVSGITTYVLGGLKVTSTFTSPTGAKYTVGYILGRVEVASVNVPVGAAVAATVSKSAATLGGISAADKAAVAKSASSAPAAVKSAFTVPNAGAPAAVVQHGAAAPTPLSGLQLAAVGTTVGKPAVRRPTATSDQSLYVMLVLAGLGVLAVQPLFSLLSRRGRN
ncbi:MAG TPA: hypothetical protein VHV82_13995 [Sporichthyaceae bacterium]|jgi:hypothetical protein|nr:hypothetical protein [Sporichthyaceae bacterium]